MVHFTTTLKKFGKQGEKTGWTYIEVPVELAAQIKSNTKKSFRVKGFLDEFSIKAIALIPMGEGNFIISLNTEIRKKIKKKKGEIITVKIEEDKKGYELNEALIDCLQDEPIAYSFFKSLTQGHQNYFSKWIDSAKSVETKSKRIAMAVNAMIKNWDYGTMIRSQTLENKKLKGL
jgi:hypothetical protein